MLLLGYLCVAALFFLAVLLLLAAALAEEARRGPRAGAAARAAGLPAVSPIEVSTPKGAPSVPTTSLPPAQPATEGAAAPVPASTTARARRAEAARVRAVLEGARQAYLALADRTGTATERRALRERMRGLRDQLRALGVDLRAPRAPRAA